MSLQAKVALIGAGGSARKFLGKHSQKSFDLYTSSGEGVIQGQSARPLDEMDAANYSKIYIAIYELHEVIESFDFSQKPENIFWFDGLEEKIYPVRDPYGESISVARNSTPNNGSLTVIYDFKADPLTFDFVVFLADADMERRKRGLQNIELILAPGDFDGFSHQWRVEDHNEKRYRLQNLIFAATQLVECHVFIHYCETRKAARAHWQSADNRHPHTHNFLHPTQRHRFNIIAERISAGEDPFILKKSNAIYANQVSNWLASNRVDSNQMVTITLRETFRSSARNSQLNEWFKFADYLNNRGFDVVFVRDTSQVFKPLEYAGRHFVFDAPSIQLMLRKELYRASYCNLLVTNGVGSINYFDDNIRYLMVGLHKEQYDDCSEKNLTHIGFGKEQLIGAKPWQRVDWREDSYENLRQGFDKLEKIINEHF